MVDLVTALLKLKPNAQWHLRGNNFDDLEWIDTEVEKPTEEEIQAKIAELEAAEPLRLLRIERDNLLTQTDWEVQRNIEKGIDNTELIAYRNALRDLPQEIEQGNVEPPTLDEQGNLVFDNWPTRGETI